MKTTDKTKRARKPKIYLEHAGFRRIGLFSKQVTAWDSRRDKVVSTLRRIIRGEKAHAKYRGYTVKARVA